MTTEDVFVWAGVALVVLGAIILVASTCMVAYLAYINSGYNPDPADRMVDRGSYKRSIGPAFGGVIIEKRRWSGFFGDGHCIRPVTTPLGTCGCPRTSQCSGAHACSWYHVGVTIIRESKDSSGVS